MLVNDGALVKCAAGAVANCANGGQCPAMLVNCVIGLTDGTLANCANGLTAGYRSRSRVRDLTSLSRSAFCSMTSFEAEVSALELSAGEGGTFGTFGTVEASKCACNLNFRQF